MITNQRSGLRAVSQSGVKTVPLLLQRGADLNATNAVGYTLLHFASREGIDEVVTVLLREGTDPDFRSNNGRTPTSPAAEKNHLRTLEILVQDNADIELANTEIRALHCAARLGNLETIAFLLTRGERTPKPNIFGTGALRYALAATNDAMNDWVVGYTNAFNQGSRAEVAVL